MTKEQHLQKISDTLIEVTQAFHQKNADIVIELHNNLLIITAQVGEEMRKIREIEKTHEST